MPTSLTSSRAFGREWRDQNSHRWHPFASEPVSDGGVAMPSDVFIDAMVLEYTDSGRPSGARVVDVDFQSGSVTVESGGAELVGELVPGQAFVRLFNGSSDCGVLCTGDGFDAGVSSGIRYSFAESGGVPLDASCVCPVATGCVTSVRLPDLGLSTDGSVIEFSGDGILVPSLLKREDGEWDLSFDAVNTGEVEDDLGKSVNGRVNRLMSIGVSAIGKTPIYISNRGMQGEDRLTLPSEIDVYTRDLTVDDLCYRAHADPGMSDIYDVCEYDGECVAENRKYAGVGWAIGGCSVWLNTPSEFVGHRNAVLISGTKGGQVPSSPRLDGLSGKEAADEVRRLLSAPVESGNGIVISIPGSSHV